MQAQGKVIAGRVLVDGAAVYEKPDFDSPVTDYLNQGSKLSVINKPVTGQAGLGIFYKIRTANGKIGYLADTDMSRGKDGRKKEATQKRREKKRRPASEDDHKNETVYLRRYIGGELAFINYTEKFSGHHLSASTPFFGLRLMGPDTIFPSAPMDFSLLISPSAPGYLKNISTGASNGYILFGDLGITLPLYDTKKNLISYGFALMWTYAAYTTTVAKQSYDSKDFRIGADFDLGYTYRIQKFSARFDFKYYLEKTMYLGEMLTLQMEY